MFFGRHKEEKSQLQERVRASELEIASLRAELESAQQEQAMLRAGLGEAEQKQSVVSQIHGNMQAFGDSLWAGGRAEAPVKGTPWLHQRYAIHCVTSHV